MNIEIGVDFSVEDYKDCVVFADAILFCPECGEQHIDKEDLEICQDCGHHDAEHFNAGERNICGGGEWNGDLHDENGCKCEGFVAWLNPPHKKHRCHSCNHVWKPFDYPTNGVLETREQPLESASADVHFSSAPSKGTASK